MKVNFKIAIAVFLIAALAAAQGQLEVFADGFKGPENLCFDGKGLIYMTDTDHLWKISPDGKKEMLYTRDKFADGSTLAGVVIGPKGMLYFSAGSRIFIMNPADKSKIELVRGFKLANGIAFDDSGNLFVADTEARTLFLVPAGTREVRTLKKGVGTINGLKWRRENNSLYYTITAPGRLGGFKLSDKLEIAENIEIAGFGTGIADDFTMDSDGNFYVCLWFGGKLVKVAQDGTKQVMIEKLDGPSAAAFGAGAFKGKLFICVKGGSLKFAGTQLAALKTGLTGYRPPFTE